MAFFDKISLEDLQLGSAIPWDIDDSNEKLLVRKGFVPQSETQLESLIQRGLYAAVDEYRKTRDPKFVPAVAEAIWRCRFLLLRKMRQGLFQVAGTGVKPAPQSRPGTV